MAAQLKNCNSPIMSKRNRKIELLAPAGNFEKLEIAAHYGSDAVYLANKEFSLRNFSGNFTLDQMEKAIAAKLEKPPPQHL